MKKVMCFGTFDLLHVGHLSYLKQAKKLGEYLIVVVARDKTKKELKKETVFSEQERLKLVKNLKVVDEAVLGNEDNQLKIIEQKKPDLICLGYDQQVDEEELKKRFPKIKVVRLKPYRENKHKSTKLKEEFLSK